MSSSRVGSDKYQFDVIGLTPPGTKPIWLRHSVKSATMIQNIHGIAYHFFVDHYLYIYKIATDTACTYMNP